MAELFKTDDKRAYLVGLGYTGGMEDLLRQYYTGLGYSGGLTDQTDAARAALNSTQLFPVVQP